MTSKPNRPNAKQREVFKEYLRIWQKLLNLEDWRVMLARKFSASGTMAEVECSLPDRWAAFRLGDFGPDKVDETLEPVAVHEMMHVLLREMHQLAINAGVEYDTVLAAEHRVINTLEPLLLALRKE